MNGPPRGLDAVQPVLLPARRDVAPVGFVLVRGDAPLLIGSLPEVPRPCPLPPPEHLLLGRIIIPVVQQDQLSAAVADAFRAGAEQKKPLNNNNAPTAGIDDFFHCSVDGVAQAAQSTESGWFKSALPRAWKASGTPAGHRMSAARSKRGHASRGL